MSTNVTGSYIRMLAAYPIDSLISSGITLAGVNHRFLLGLRVFAFQGDSASVSLWQGCNE